MEQNRQREAAVWNWANVFGHEQGLGNGGGKKLFWPPSEPPFPLPVLLDRAEWGGEESLAPPRTEV